MNSIVIENNSDDLIEICDDKIINHYNEILKSKPNLVITVLDRGIFSANVVEKNKKSLTIKLYKALKSRNYNEIELLVGACRPQTAKKVINYALTLGVGKITFVKAQLSEKSYLSSKIYEKESLVSEFKKALGQSKIYFQTPKIELFDYIPYERYDENYKKSLLSLNGKLSFNKTYSSSKLVLAFGPERGWTEDEETKFLSYDFEPVKISNSILRLEQAVSHSLGQIELFNL